MNVTSLLICTLLLAIGIGVGIALAAGWWRTPAAGRSNPTLEVAALLAPASDALVRVEQRLREVERDRVGAYAGLREQVAALHRTSTDLGSETRSLVNALRAPMVRGRWGEVQLQRIVELAGMVEHCDFDTQVSAAVADAAGVRPDMIVRLAGGRHIPVDAKVPFEAWLQAREGADEPRRGQLMAMHARAMRAHVDALAAKAYWQHFQPAPEFVVMFVPGEPLLDAAMTIDPGLTEYAFARNVVIATPTTLIALLRTVAFTWRQERLSESASGDSRAGPGIARPMVDSRDRTSPGWARSGACCGVVQRRRRIGGEPGIGNRPEVHRPRGGDRPTGDPGPGSHHAPPPVGARMARQ